MTVDEYEAIRLIDLEGFTQEECAEQMGVARSTVQGIYLEARKKLAEVLVNGKLLFIEGGEYRLCEGSGTACGRACRRHRLGLCFATEKTVRPDPNTNERRTPMKIAIPVEENIGRQSQFFASVPRILFLIPNRTKPVLSTIRRSKHRRAGILSAPRGRRRRDTLLTPRLGKPADDTRRGMQVFQSKEGTRKRISKLMCKTLKVLKKYTKVFMVTETGNKRIAVLAAKAAPQDLSDGESGCCRSFRILTAM